MIKRPIRSIPPDPIELVDMIGRLYQLYTTSPDRPTRALIEENISKGLISRREGEWILTKYNAIRKQTYKLLVDALALRRMWLQLAKLLETIEERHPRSFV